MTGLLVSLLLALAARTASAQVTVPEATPAPAASPDPSPEPAAGGPPAENGQADALLEEGVRLFAEDADYESALDRFRRSFALAPSWKALNGIALVFQAQSRFLEALETYERLKSEFGTTLAPNQLATVELRIQEVEREIGCLDLDVAQAHVKVSVDGNPVGVGPTRARVRVSAGAHIVIATGAGWRPYARTIEVPAGSVAPVRVVLAAERRTVEVVMRPVKLVRPLPGWAPAATIGGGVALTLLGVVVTRRAATDFSAFDREIRSEWEDLGTAAPLDDATRDLLRAGETKRDIALGVCIAGGLVTVAGVVLLVSNHPAPRPEPSGLLAQRTRPTRPPTEIAVVPTVGGASVRIRF